MTVRAYIATEGPHDVAFLAELLRPWGLKRLTKEEEVDVFWVPLIPKTFPHKGDLLARAGPDLLHRQRPHGRARLGQRPPGNELRALGPPIDPTTFPSAIYFGER